MNVQHRQGARCGRRHMGKLRRWQLITIILAPKFTHVYMYTGRKRKGTIYANLTHVYMYYYRHVYRMLNTKAPWQPRRIKHCKLVASSMQCVRLWSGLYLNTTVIKSQICNWASRKQRGFQKRPTGNDNGERDETAASPQTLGLPL